LRGFKERAGDLKESAMLPTTVALSALQSRSEWSQYKATQQRDKLKGYPSGSVKGIKDGDANKMLVSDSLS